MNGVILIVIVKKFGLKANENGALWDREISSNIKRWKVKMELLHLVLGHEHIRLF